MLLYLLLGLLVGCLLASATIFFLSKRSQPDSQKTADLFFSKFYEKFPEILNQANQSLISTANQKLAAEKQDIATDLGNKKQAIETLVSEIRKQLEDNNKKIEQAEQGRIGSFESLKTQLSQQAQLTQQLSVTTEGLKKILNNNQLRGQFGEQIAEDLLKMAGFVGGTDYQKQLEGATSRPDFTIFMPDGSHLNVDSKFPYANLVKMAETEDKESKENFKRAFLQDIKNKIKEVTTRDYIDPSTKTVDFVLLFIPNEMIFSFIYENFPELWQEALVKKVVMAGPFSFTALLRLIRQSYDSFKLQSNLQEVLTQIQSFQNEFAKYNQEFEKIGDKIEAVAKQYEAVNSTRTRQLVRTMDKIKLTPKEPELLT